MALEGRPQEAWEAGTRVVSRICKLLLAKEHSNDLGNLLLKEDFSKVNVFEHQRKPKVKQLSFRLILNDVVDHKRSQETP